MSSPSAQNPAQNTLTLMYLAHDLLSAQVIEGVVAAGHRIKPSHAAVFAQIGEEGARLTDLARGASMTPQAMGEIVDELEGLGYLVRQPDPSDRRAKLIRLTEAGADCVAAGTRTIDRIESRLSAMLGQRGYRQFRNALRRVLDEA